MKGVHIMERFFKYNCKSETTCNHDLLYSGLDISTKVKGRKRLFSCLLLLYKQCIAAFCSKSKQYMINGIHRLFSTLLLFEFLLLCCSTFKQVQILHRCQLAKPSLSCQHEKPHKSYRHIHFHIHIHIRQTIVFTFGTIILYLGQQLHNGA